MSTNIFYSFGKYTDDDDDDDDKGEHRLIHGKMNAETADGRNSIQ